MYQYFRLFSDKSFSQFIALGLNMCVQPDDEVDIPNHSLFFRLLSPRENVSMESREVSNAVRLSKQLTVQVQTGKVETRPVM